MTTPEVRRHVAATADDVFAVLADGWLYPVWVVGASRMREVDDHWPAVGARLHHSVGVWPALLDDQTTLLVWEPGARAVLEAKGRPLGVARVVLEVEPDGPAGCLVSIAEDTSRGPAALLPKPVRQAAMVKRNTETLRRLAFLAEGRARS